MPARRRVQASSEDAPPLRRSERIRLRTLAAAATQAAEAAREESRGLGIARSSHTIRRPTRRTRNALNRAAVEAVVETNSRENDIPVQNSSSRAAAADSSEDEGAAAPEAPAVTLAAPDRDPDPSVSTVRMEQRAAQRIRRELQQFHEDPPEGCHLEVDDNIFCWMVTIDGPKDTPYEGGKFKLILNFDYEYPFKAPHVRFLTKLYHCNISPEGFICLDLLKTHWSPALTVSKLLLSIISLLSDPSPEDPLVPTHAAVYERDREEYEVMARLWTSVYAKPNPPSTENED